MTTKIPFPHPTVASYTKFTFAQSRNSIFVITVAFSNNSQDVSYVCVCVCFCNRQRLALKGGFKAWFLFFLWHQLVAAKSAEGGSAAKSCPRHTLHFNRNTKQKHSTHLIIRGDLSISTTAQHRVFTGVNMSTPLPIWMPFEYRHKQTKDVEDSCGPHSVGGEVDTLHNTLLDFL